MKKPEMTPRERIMAAVNHQPTDRVPMDYWGVGEITHKLMRHFNVSDSLGLAKAMDLDMIMGVDAPMINKERMGVWDIKYQSIPLPDGSGHYDEPVSCPIGACESIDEIEAAYEWPTTDMFDYSNIKKRCRELRDQGYAVTGGNISLAYFYSMIRGVEQMLMDFAADPKLAEYILFKINEFAAGHSRKLLEAADGLIDITHVTDDLGSQTGLLFSTEMIERYLGRYYEAGTAMAREFGAKVFHHDDGAIQELVPWLVEKGCEILNPIQWHLPGWDLAKLKTEHGEKLCFHGGIDNQYVLPFGSPEDVKAEVRACMDALYADSTGYILAPCHNIQAITPLENVFTMYEYAKTYKTG